MFGGGASWSVWWGGGSSPPPRLDRTLHVARNFSEIDFHKNIKCHELHKVHIEQRFSIGGISGGKIGSSLLYNQFSFFGVTSTSRWLCS